MVMGREGRAAFLEYHVCKDTKGRINAGYFGLQDR
jgi:hypothetical protein